jgi:hypothetical protein
MSTSDFREVDEEAMELASPKLIVLTASPTETITLEPFETR